MAISVPQGFSRGKCLLPFQNKLEQVLKRQPHLTPPVLWFSIIQLHQAINSPPRSVKSMKCSSSLKVCFTFSTSMHNIRFAVPECFIVQALSILEPMTPTASFIKIVHYITPKSANLLFAKSMYHCRSNLSGTETPFTSSLKIKQCAGEFVNFAAVFLVA